MGVCDVGRVIRELREQRHMTQAELARQIGVSDKAVSKWETGRGCPDISLMETLGEALGTSSAELLGGRAVRNDNVAANMLRSKIYVCPVCGNVVCSSGEAYVCCHGSQLLPLEAQPAAGEHALFARMVEGELFVTSAHPMDKDHHLTLLFASSPDRVQVVRLYPEGPAEARIMRQGVRNVYVNCSRHGLFYAPVARLFEGGTCSCGVRSAPRRPLG